MEKSESVGLYLCTPAVSDFTYSVSNMKFALMSAWLGPAKIMHCILYCIKLEPLMKKHVSR
jgi:hypothetical protein